MAQATMTGGALKDITNCYINVGGSGAGPIPLKILPDISDSKAATYIGEPIIGRASPFKTYAHSEERTINMMLHFMVTKKGDALNIQRHIRWLQSAVYPRDTQTGDSPYIPPPICQIKCGGLLGDDPLCVVLRSYSMRYPTDVAWDTSPDDQGNPCYIPMKLDMETVWDVVYQSSKLPGQKQIIFFGS